MYERRFIMEYLTMVIDTGKFLQLRYDRCVKPEFINTVPRSLTYFAKYDLSGGARRDSLGRTASRMIVDTYNDLGTEFTTGNGGGNSITEIGNLSNYSIMLNNFLKEYGLYNTGAPGELISADSINAARLNGSFRNPKSVTASNTPRHQLKAEGKAQDGTVVAPKVKAEEKEKTLEELMEELDSLVGLDAVKQDLTNLINLIKVRKMREERGMKQPDITLHLVFSGNPGTGKTTVARLLAKIYKALGVVSGGQLVEVDRSDLVVGYIGQTAIKTAEVVDSAIGGILFIDEAYTLTAGKDEKDFGKEALDTLLKRMEDNRNDLIVIVAGYTDLMEEFIDSNPGLRSRFNKNIFFKDYTGEELYKIFQSMCKKQEYTPDKKAAAYIRNYLDTRAKSHEENFANAREVRNFLERCIERQASRIVTKKDVSDKQLRTLTIADCEEEGYPAE
ncbi:MAG: AAA family ATPase [Eubacterium sp.]|nr:AAA family ATPase [Eubacterium sp.]